MAHGFSAATKDFPGLLECHQSTNFHLLEMQAKPEPSHCSNEDASEDMEYMMEIPFECDNGTEAVSTFLALFLLSKKRKSPRTTPAESTLQFIKVKFIDFRRNFEEISILQQENKRDSKFRFREKIFVKGYLLDEGRRFHSLASTFHMFLPKRRRSISLWKLVESDKAFTHN